MTFTEESEREREGEGARLENGIQERTKRAEEEGMGQLREQGAGQIRKAAWWWGGQAGRLREEL